MIFRHELKHEINFSDLLPSGRDCVRRRSRINTLSGESTACAVCILTICGIKRSEKNWKGSITGKNSGSDIITGIPLFSVWKKRLSSTVLEISRKPRLSEEEDREDFSAGDYRWRRSPGRPLVTELYSKMMSQGLRPKAIVDYTREPFTYRPGNVRVTLDYNLRDGNRLQRVSESGLCDDSRGKSRDYHGSKVG